MGPMFMAVLNNLPGAMTVLKSVMRWWPLVFTTLKLRQIRIFMEGRLAFLKLGPVLGKVGRVGSKVLLWTKSRVPWRIHPPIP